MKIYVAITIALVVNTSKAEYWIDFDPILFSGSAAPAHVYADIGFAPGNSYEADFSGPSGFPLMYHAVWTRDAEILSPTPINSFTIDYGCGTETVTIPPFSVFYIPGPANPPWEPTTFSSMFCDGITPPELYTYQEHFNAGGQLSLGWTVQSQSATLTTPWAPILESGNDWAVQTSQTAFSVPQVEWLISPVFNITGYQDIELGYTHNYTHASSTATVKYSTNGGVAWQDLMSYEATISGNVVTDISSWADGATNVRFAFVFTGQFVVGGASWRIDDFFLNGVLTPPIANAPVPSQPPAIWNGLVGTVGCTWTHPLGVSGSDLEIRIDSNGDGDYSDGGSEDWTALPGTIDAGTLEVAAQVAYANDGLHQAFELRARSGTSLWGYSGTSGTEGISDDWYVSIVEPDSIPPTSSTLLTGGSSANSVTLLFLPTVEDHFARYEFRCSTDSLVDESDLLWTDSDDPTLAQIGTYTTTVTGLASGTAWYFRMWAVDQAANRSPASNRVRKVTEGSQVFPVTDLHAAVQGNGIQLTWTAPTTDIYGQSPVAIEHFEVHSSVDPFFTPNAGTRIGTTSGTSYFVSTPGGDVRSCFKVVVVGAGHGNPFPVPMILVPAGTFMMGADNGENAVLHEVTLTKSFWLGRYEVTNQQYVEYLNWAISHNRIHVSESTITGINVYSNVTEQILTTIRNGSGQWSEIRYIDSENRFTVEPSSWIAGDTGPGYAYPLGYDPSSLPVTAVSWHGAALYCNWLSNQESLEEYYGTGSGVGIPSSTGSGNPYNATGYRLPTSAEWERAARYNDSREYPWGDSEPNCDLANSRHGGVCLGWTSEASAYTEGESQLGFNCLAGNVNEWCNDRVYLYSPNPVTDPIGSTYAGNSQRVTRGGHYSSPASELQNYMGLDRADPGVVEWVYGFRVCRVYAVN